MQLFTTLFLLWMIFFVNVSFPTEKNISEPVMCTLTVDAGPDMTVCEPGQTVTLFGTVSGDFLDVEWAPFQGLSNPNSPVTDATVNNTTTYTLTATSLDGNNLIMNANFDAGLTGFTSDYVPGTGGSFGLLTNEGEFAIATNAADTHDNFAPCTDHTGGGNMLVVNGAGVPNQDVWCQVVNINPNTDYAFSAWVASVISSSPAQLQFSVNGQLIGGIFSASPATCVWNEFFATWNSGGSTSAEICIVNQNTALSGNDFAIDDLSFGEICEATDQVTVTVIDLDASFFPPTGLCPLSPIIDLNSLLSPLATAGGMWTINSNPTQFLDPFILGPGLHSLNYTVTEGPCTESNPQNFIIEPLPDPGWTVPEVCLGTPPFDLNTLLLGGAEPGGTWLINGIQNNIFNPAILSVGPHLVSYTVGTAPCVSELEQFIEVDALPNAGWTAPDDLCVTTSPADLNDWLDADADTGGTWTVDGTQTTTFDPQVLGEGSHSVIYAVGTFPCANQLAQFIEIGAAPEVPMPVCGPTTSSSILFAWQDLANATSYSVTVLTNQQGTLVNNTYSLTDLAPGEEVQIQVTAISDGPCGNSTSEVVSCTTTNCEVPEISINSPDSVCLDINIAPFDLSYEIDGEDSGTATWSGSGIVDPVNGTFDHLFAGAGTHTVSLNYEIDNCTATLSHDIEVLALPASSFSFISPICRIDTATVTYTGNATSNAVYHWNFDGANIISGTGQGPYRLIWDLAGTYEISLSVEENNCQSEETLQEIVVEPTLVPPTINCNSTDSEITFFWNPIANAEAYNIEVSQGPAGMFTSDTSYLVNNLNAGDEVIIDLTIESANSCNDLRIEHTCVAEECPDVELNILPIGDICVADSLTYDFNTEISGASTLGDGEWEGPGIIDTDTGLFDPNVAGPGSHQIIYIYTESPNCIFTTDIIVEIPAASIAAFSAPDTICVEDTAEISFTGMAANDASFNWNFDGANIQSGSGAGPYTLSWPQAGSYEINLEIEDGSCTVNANPANIVVDPILEAPEISCTATFTSIEFTWQEIANAESYTVIASGGVMTGNNTYRVESLQPEEEVQIEVIAHSSNACPSSSSLLTCTTLPCPPVILQIESLAPVCFEPGLNPIQLNYSINGDNPAGSISWTGNGISNPDTGLWQVDESMIGQDNWVYLTYTEDVCIFRDSLLIEVNAIPVADFDFPPVICQSESALIEFSGTADPGVAFSWTFESAIPPFDTGPGPHQVSWAEEGDYNLQLIITENGCTSEINVQSIQVDPLLEMPAIHCEADYNEIIISWDAVPNAEIYTLSISNDTIFENQMLNTTSFSLDGLDDGTEVQIELIANSINSCPSVSQMINCSTTNCPEAALSISYPQAICEGDDTPLIFNFSGNTGPFEIELMAGSQIFQLEAVTNGRLETFDLPETTDFQVLSVINTAAPVCSVELPEAFSITVNAPVDAGLPTESLRFCSGLDTFILLADLLLHESPGGNWMETSTIPSTGGAFDAASGLFIPSDQQAGTYSFLYSAEALAPCPNDTTLVQIRIDETPVADAGTDLTLDCVLDLVSIGGSATSTGNNIEYHWTAQNGNIIEDNTQSVIEVMEPDTYRLEVWNTATGCSATDEVIVNTDVSLLNPNISISPVTCFRANDGLINVLSVEGGAGPYSYALNGGDFGSQPYFPNLPPGNYVLTIRDSKGCETQLEFDFDQPEELQVRLVSNLEGDPAALQLGDSVLLSALVNVPAESIDTLIWFPDALNCPNCFHQTVSPQTTSAYSVMVIDENGCSDSDNLTLFVQKERDIFIPNGFSPNNDGINDVAMIFAGQEVETIQSFQIFTRWGEIVFEAYNFQPNNPTYGWDGIFNGKIMNPAVFVYYAEIEFIDGQVEIFKGDISLMR